MANNRVYLLACLKSVQLQIGCGGAIPRDSSGLSLILRVALGDGKFPDLPLLDSLLENKEITRIDKIDALEMAGAVILSYDKNHENFPLAFQYWRRALALRLMVTEEAGPIYKTPLKSKSGQPSEWSTLDDLQRIKQQPFQRKIQCFLVRLRILSNISWSAIRSHFFQSFLEFLYVELHREDSISTLLDLAWSTVDTILRSERPHEENMQGSFIQIVAVVNLNLFRLKKDDLNLNSENLIKLVELVLMTYSSHMMTSPAAQDAQMSFVCCMFILLSRHPELITEEIRLSLLQLVHRDGRNSYGSNLLHSACNIPDSVSEALPTIRLLVNLGADLNARNNVGNGVFHILAVKE